MSDPNDRDADHPGPREGCQAAVRLVGHYHLPMREPA